MNLWLSLQFPFGLSPFSVWSQKSVEMFFLSFGGKKSTWDEYDIHHVLSEIPTGDLETCTDGRQKRCCFDQKPINQQIRAREKLYSKKNQNNALSSVLSIYPALRSLQLYSMSNNGHLIFEGYCHVQPLSQKHKHRGSTHRFSNATSRKIWRNESQQYASMLPSASWLTFHGNLYSLVLMRLGIVLFSLRIFKAGGAQHSTSTIDYWWEDKSIFSSAISAQWNELSRHYSTIHSNTVLSPACWTKQINPQ